ncbi:DUF2637 domain-containing protein [Microbacterium sp. 22303]|uniref:DUF2637 domain-containing protein n=1 Tax=Microbacterium sp. 22303 TaxID=3453905 RepID=UPI003F834F38
MIASSVIGTLLLAFGAFWLSFTTLADLATLAGISAGRAWVWPLIVDGVVLEATISIVALRRQARTARRYAWILLAAGAAVSVAANVAHAVVTADTRVPSIVSALVASVPPLVLLAMTHLTVELTHSNATTPDPGPQPTRSLVAAPALTASTSPMLEGASSEPASAQGRSGRPKTARRRPPADPATRRRAVELAAQKVPQRQIAEELGVHPTTVGRWLAAPDVHTEGAHT